MEELTKAMEILEKLSFFGGQRAGRELWNDKPRVVQDEDIAAFNRDVQWLRDFIRKHMNDGWILVVRGLPELNEDELSEDVLISFSDSYSICIGFYDFNEKRWYVHGSGPCIGRVVAWRPLPEPYRPERSTIKQ